MSAAWPAAGAVAGFVLGLQHFIGLQQSVALLGTGTIWRLLAVRAGHGAATIAGLTGCAAIGPGVAASALAGFLVARVCLVRRTAPQ